MLSAGAPGTRRRGALAGSVISRRGDLLVSQAQRSRMLSSAAQVIAESGYNEMSVVRVTTGAGVSRRTFYDLFEDREDCFLAVFDDALARAQEAMLAAWQAEGGWSEQVRGALLALLLFLDREPGLGRLLVVDALKAGSRVQARRSEVLAQLGEALHHSGTAAKAGRELPGLTGEGVVGAVLGVIHTRLLTKRPGPMVELLGPLMGVVVLPYLGHAAAQRQLTRPAPKLDAPRARPRAYGGPGDPLGGLPMRVTHRTLLVLAAIEEAPGGSNRQIATQAGVADQGQISRLLTRLEGLGLIENTGEGQPCGEPNQWHLTARGQQIQRATQTRTQPSVPKGRGATESR